jgi:hypothetical protein
VRTPQEIDLLVDQHQQILGSKPYAFYDETLAQYVDHEDEIDSHIRFAAAALAVHKHCVSEWLRHDTLFMDHKTNMKTKALATQLLPVWEQRKGFSMKNFMFHKTKAKELAQKRQDKKDSHLNKLVSQPIKLNLKLATIPKLTLDYLGKKTFWEWLVNFDQEIGPADDRTLVAYLKNSTYIDMAVYKGGLKLLSSPHTFEKLVLLLDQTHPDRTTQEQRLEKFRLCQQTTNKVAAYQHWKEFYWTLAYPDLEPSFAYPLFEESWINGLHILLKKKVKKFVSRKKISGKSYNYASVQKLVTQEEFYLIEHVEEYKRFSKKNSQTVNHIEQLVSTSTSSSINSSTVANSGSNPNSQSNSSATQKIDPASSLSV